MVADGKPLWFKIITTNLHFLNFSLRTNCKKKRKKFREKRRKIILNLCSVNEPNRFTGLLKKTRCFRYCFIRFCLSNYFYFFCYWILKMASLRMDLKTYCLSKNEKIFQSQSSVKILILTLKTGRRARPSCSMHIKLRRLFSSERGPTNVSPLMR